MFENVACVGGVRPKIWLVGLILATFFGGPALTAAAYASPGEARAIGKASPAKTSRTDHESTNVLHLTLKDAVQLGNAGASRMSRAERSVEILKLQASSARGAYFPRLDVAVSANQSASGSDFRSSDVSARRRLVGDFRSGVNASASVPIDLSGIIARQVRSAQISHSIALLEQERVGLETAADVQLAYFGALQAQSAVELDEQVIASIRLLRASAQLPASVISFIGLELANAEQTLNQRIAARDQAIDTLKRLLGLEPNAEVILASRLPTIAELKASVDLSSLGGVGEGRNDLTIAEKRVDQAELTVKRAGDQRRPNMRAGVYLDQYVGGKFVSDTGKTSTRNVGFNLSVNVPVLNVDAGQAGNTKKIARLQADQARADYEEVRRQIGYDLKQARSAWARASDRLTRLPHAGDAARALESAQKNLLAASPHEAQSQLPQLSNARQTWRSAEGAARDAVAELASAAIRLRRAEGKIIESEDLDRRPS